MKNNNSENITIQRIKELKGEDNQITFGNKINLSQGGVSKLLQGDSPSAAVLISISKNYNVSVDWLLGLSDIRTIQNANDTTKVTYSDLIILLDQLLDKKTIYPNGQVNSTIFYTRDKVLCYLIETRSEVSKLDSETRSSWYKTINRFFSEVPIPEWRDKYDKQYERRFNKIQPELEDLVNFVNEIHDENTKK